MAANCDLPLDLELTERVEVDDETLPQVEEDWDCPEQTEIDKGIQPDFPDHGDSPEQEMKEQE